MRSSLATQVVSALLVPALLASGAAQALAMRCDAAVMSCCAKKTQPVSASTMTGEAHKCCPQASAPTPQEEAAQRTATPPAPVPMLVAVVGAVVGVSPRPTSERADVPALDPPPGPPLVLANCSLLI